MKRIYLFLFIFSLVINIFQYKNDSQVLAAKDEHIKLLEQKLSKAEDSIKKLNNQPLS